MNLPEWRKSRSLTLAEAASLFGIADANPGRTLQRYEKGERRPSAVLIALIEKATHGQVTAQDMHETRLHWERESAEAAVAE